MEEDEAVVRLAALSAPSRLAVVRQLAAAGPEGLASGDIAKALDVAPNTISTQLLLLSNARVVKAKRAGRAVIYTLRPEAKAELETFLDRLWGDAKTGKVA